MRHQVKTKKLGLKKAHRDLLFINQIKSLINNGSVVTTETKAKLLKANIDKLITLAKRGTTTQFTLRTISERLNDKVVAARFVNYVLPKLGNRTSGYTSLIKLYNRTGDNSSVIKVTLLDIDTVAEDTKKTK